MVFFFPDGCGSTRGWNLKSAPAPASIGFKIRRYPHPRVELPSLFLAEGWDLAVEEEEEPSVQESINQADRRETRLISLLSFLWITISPYIELIHFLKRK